MKYVLNLAEDGRILSAGIYHTALPEGAIEVAALPTGDTEAEKRITNYCYVDGEFIYAPLPESPNLDLSPTQLDRIEAQITYTAMMTDTLLEV